MSQFQETVILASGSQESTILTGRSLTKSFYGRPLTIFLLGELGAGKTTLVKGIGAGLSINDIMTSPTFAIENRFADELLHMDLYRLDPSEAKRMVRESDEYPGVRVIEWPDRMYAEEMKCIEIEFDEFSQTDRAIRITFRDMDAPDRQMIEAWRNRWKLPPHIRAHCDTVGAFARELATQLIARGIVVRCEAMKIAGELHDLFRFLDFLKAEERVREPEWQEAASLFPYSHEEACSRFLISEGYPEIAKIIAPHGLMFLDRNEPFETIEQEILFYADKRVMGEMIVSLDERFDDFSVRYGNGKESEDAKRWRFKTKALEKELFGKNIP